jgi:hypothetical protein
MDELLEVTSAAECELTNVEDPVLVQAAFDLSL